jgi:serine/threonine protein phosphatase 1
MVVSMNRILVFSDIHGEYDKLIKLLNKMKYNSDNDTIIFLGDAIDRGPNSKKVVKKMKELKKEGNIILNGNHEDMAWQYAKHNVKNKASTYDPYLYLYNGGRETLRSYEGDLKEFYNDMKWFNNQPKVYTLETNSDEFVFVHAGLKPNVPLYAQDEEDLLWIREEFFYHNWNDYDKKIIVGHTPVEQAEFLGNIIMIDTGCGKGGYLTGLDLLNGKIYTVK